MTLLELAAWARDWLPWRWLRHRCHAGHARALPPAAWVRFRWLRRHRHCAPTRRGRP